MTRILALLLLAIAGCGSLAQQQDLANARELCAHLTDPEFELVIDTGRRFAEQGLPWEDCADASAAAEFEFQALCFIAVCNAVY